MAQDHFNSDGVSGGLKINCNFEAEIVQFKPNQEWNFHLIRWIQSGSDS